MRTASASSARCSRASTPAGRPSSSVPSRATTRPRCGASSTSERKGRRLRVELNGKPKELAEGTTLLSLAPERVAVELNRDVVRRADWPATRLSDGDRVEIVHFVGGG